MFTKELSKTKLLSRPGAGQRVFHLRDSEDAGRQKGFTLIEIIVTLVIVGILAVAGGMGIVHVAKGFVTVKQNSTTTQKVQLAMSRMGKDIREMSAIYAAANSTQIPITNYSQVDSSGNFIGSRIIGFDNAANAVKIGIGGNLTAGDILIDGVRSVSFTYYQASNVSSTWPTGQDNLLSGVGVNITMINPPMSFYNFVACRNNGNLGGLSGNVTDLYGAPAGWGTGCFVATAAYGDVGHPMVQILRDFRDRYLVTWSGGRWLVKKYYQYGPAMADMIRNRPIAMLAVRCLLVPVVGVAFCLMYAPLVIPVIVIVLLILTSDLFSAFRRRWKFVPGISRERGSILLSLIITMVIMVALIAAMVPMFSSSLMNQAQSDNGREACLLAESGFRSAGAQYRYSTDKCTTCVNMHGQTYKMLNNVGSFSLSITPMWFETQATAANATSLTTDVCGGVPSEFPAGSPYSGYIYVTDVGYYKYNTYSVSGSQITFSTFTAQAPTSLSTLPAIGTDVAVRPLVVTTASSQSLSKNGNLSIISTGASAFPIYKGSFTMIDSSGNKINDGATFSYTTRVGTTLNNITMEDPTKNAAWSSAITIPASTVVVLKEFLRIASTGTSGISTCTRTYETPLQYSAGGGAFEAQVKNENMDSSADFFTGTEAAGTQTFSGGKMTPGTMIKATDAGGLFSGLFGLIVGILDFLIDLITINNECANADPTMNMVAWNWTTTTTNLAKSWMDSYGCLTYDLQTKISANVPYFQAGVGFRGRENSSTEYFTYGVSFAKVRRHYQNGETWCVTCLSKDQFGMLLPPFNNATIFPASVEKSGTNSSWCSKDGLPVYDYGMPAIVLWEIRSGSDAEQMHYLAYRALSTADAIVQNNASSWPRLKDDSTLLLRLTEGYPLTFTTDSGCTGGEIREGDVIKNSTGTKTARVVMTPILTSSTGKKADWTNKVAAGTLVLANVRTPTDTATTFNSSDYLYVSGAKMAKAGTFTNTKRNFIRVYYSGTAAAGTANYVETDNNRYANPVSVTNWPPDSLTSLETDSTKDNFTLVQWSKCNNSSYGGEQNCTGVGSGVQTKTSTSQPNAIIETSLLLSPSWTTASTVSSFVQGTGGTLSGDTIAIMTFGDSGTSVKYDDFACRLKINAGLGFSVPFVH